MLGAGARCGLGRLAWGPRVGWAGARRTGMGPEAGCVCFCGGTGPATAPLGPRRCGGIDGMGPATGAWEVGVTIGTCVGGAMGAARGPPGRALLLTGGRRPFATGGPEGWELRL